MEEAEVISATCTCAAQEAFLSTLAETAQEPAIGGSLLLTIALLATAMLVAGGRCGWPRRSVHPPEELLG